MDRLINYPGAVPLETDLLNTNKNVLMALAYLAQSVLGTATLFDGLPCAPTAPASLQVKVSAGSCYTQAAADGTAFSSLNADTHPIIKQGISQDDVLLTCVAPTTSGFSINYLIQAEYADSDTDAVVLPYYNASNPAQAYSGPNNTGASNYTRRKGSIVLQAKAGIGATTGTQTTPTPDAGYTGLYVVTVANGQTMITSGNIAVAAGAPFIGGKLPSKVNLTDFTQSFATNGYQTLPSGLIIQWGMGTAPNTGVSNSTGSITFPIAFPVGALSVTGNSTQGSRGGTNIPPVVAITAMSATAFTYQLDTLQNSLPFQNAVNFNWMALGR